MLEILTFDLDDMGAGGEKLLAILAIVLAAILMLIIRDLLVWFEGLGSEATAEADEAAQMEPGDGRIAPPANSFIDRRDHANPPTGFGRRRDDVTALAHPRSVSQTA